MEFRRVEQHKGQRSSLPDWESQDAIVKVKLKLRAYRDFRAAIMQLAYWIQEDHSKQAYLLLIEPGISQNRLAEEWAKARKLFQADIAKHMWIGTYRNDAITWQSRDLPRKIEEQLNHIAREETQLHETLLPKPDYSAEVLKLLVCHWILNRDHASHLISDDSLLFIGNARIPREPLTSKWLEEAVGCTYRTISNALEDIGSALIRHRNQSMELSCFPRNAWEKMLVLSNNSRTTMRFTDKSGQPPRFPESLLKRLSHLQRMDIAIGGVLGATRIFPELDLTGPPRLDLTVHCSKGSIDMSFIRMLDPALKKWTVSDPRPSLVIHFLRREEPFFKIGTNGRLWADPIECLLDLQDARLEHQALQFRNAIIPGDAYRWPNQKM
jgi:hypothetical protein